MEIRLKATGNTPHYLAELCVSREGAEVVFQVADESNYEKARYVMPATKFAALAELLLGDE